jgi:hypothetical protein
MLSLTTGFDTLDEGPWVETLLVHTTVSQNMSSYTVRGQRLSKGYPGWGKVVSGTFVIAHQSN